MHLPNCSGSCRPRSEARGRRVTTARAMSGWRLLQGRGDLRGLTMSSSPYRGFRFPPEVSQHAVWLYHFFSLSLRDVELILAVRGNSYESMREWGLRFGRPDLRQYAEAAPATIGRQGVHGRGVHPDPRQAARSWVAVDQDGNVPDILVHSLRNATSARRFFRKLLKGLRYDPWYGDGRAKGLRRHQARDLPSVEHCQS